MASEPSIYSLDMIARYIQGLYSLSGKTSYRQISWSLEAARLGVIMNVSLWNLTAVEVPIKIETDWKKIKPESRAFYTSRDLAVRRPSAYWTEAQDIVYMYSVGKYFGRIFLSIQYIICWIRTFRNYLQLRMLRTMRGPNFIGYLWCCGYSWGWLGWLVLLLIFRRAWLVGWTRKER